MPSVIPHLWRRRTPRLRLLLLATLVTALGAFAFWFLTPPPSVILITIDAQRPDRLGAYGHPSNRTPAIDRLAGEGMLFEHAYCDIPWTTGSMASVMTGQYSGKHGLQLPTDRLKPQAVTMAEILHDRGFQTGAIVASFPLDAVYGLDQGFETYDDKFDLPMIAVTGHTIQHVPSQLPGTSDAQGEFISEKFKNDAYRSDEAVTDAAIHWLKNIRDGRRFFLWVHYFGPHEKPNGDSSFVDQEPDMIAAYDADVEAADRAVGRLIDQLRALELLDKTLVVVHADHGQNLGEQGVFGHGIRLDEATTRIPLILRYPSRIPAGLRRVDVAHNIDILSTVLAVVGAEAKELDGRSLLPSREDPRGAYVPIEQQIAYYETLATTFVYVPLLVPKYWMVLGPVKRSGLRTAEWRFVSDEVVGPCSYGKAQPSRDGFGTWVLPDATQLDEHECKKIRSTSLYAVSALGDREAEVSRQYPDVVAAMEELLRAHAHQGEQLADKFNLSAEQKEKLRSLGYLR